MFSSSLPLLIVPLLAHLVAAQGQTCSRWYTVQEGDICDSISAAQNVSTYQLAVVNDNVIDPECYNLESGENICLGWVGQDCQQTYVIQAGDYCDTIYSKFGLSPSVFYGNNPQVNSDCTNMYIGEVMCVAQSVDAPPPPSGTIPGTTIPATGTPSLPWCD